MKWLEWDAADREQRIELVKSAYSACVTKVKILSGEEDGVFKRALNRRFYEENWWELIVNVCEKYNLDGVEYVQAQFYFWPKSDRYPLIPSLRIIAGGKRALRNYRKWMDAQPLNAAYSDKAKKERAIREAQAVVDGFIRTNKALYPDAKTVLRVPAILHMLPVAYLEQSPEFQELIKEGYYRKSA